MINNSKIRNLIIGLLLTLFLIGFAVPVRAFNAQGGDTIHIAAGETINDNLYINAQTFIMDGSVKGDLFAGGGAITNNGSVDGDVMAVGRTIIINGTVNGDVRIAGGALYMGENAKVTGEVLAFGASLETRKGSLTGKDILFYGGQALLSGDVTRDLRAGTAGLKIEGNIGGNVNVEVGDSANSGPDPSMFLPQSNVVLPHVPAGLAIDPAVKIGGKLVYTSSKEISLPANIAAGGVQHLQPQIKPEDIVKTPTLSERIMTGIFDALRRMVTLILFGLILIWLFPTFLKKATLNIQSAAFSMMGWGIVAWAAFFFAILVLIIATIVGALIFGVLTLGNISGIIILLGSLSLFALSTGFMLASAHVAQIIVSILGGRLILARVKPEWSEHKTWPLIVGAVIFAILCAIPILGWLINFMAILLGLGALWVLGKDALQRQQQPAI